MVADRPAPVPARAPALPALGAVLAATLALFVFRSALSFGFVSFDDDLQVYLNPHLGAPTGPRLAWIFLTTGYNGYYMPLTWLSLSLISALAGLHPEPYHAALVGFHALNAALVFILLRRLLSALAPRRFAAAGPWADGCALLGSLWWSLNPLRVESVAWISGLCYAQAIACALGSVIVFLGPAGTPGAGARRPWLRPAGATALYACSLLSYPIALGLAPVFLLLDWYLGRIPRDRPPPRYRTAGILVAAVAVLGVTLAAARKTNEHFHIADATLPLSVRAARAGYALSYYGYRPWVPIHLTRAYPATVLRADLPAVEALRAFWSPLLLEGIAATLLLGLLCMVGPVFRRLLGPFLLCHVLLLAPMLGITFGGEYITYDRYCTLACVAWAAGIALVLLGAPRPRRAWLAGGLGCYLVVLAALSIRQTRAWRNDPALWSSITARLSPREFPGLQYEHPAYVDRMSGRYDQAEAVVDRGLRALPGFPPLLAAREEIAQFRGDHAVSCPFAEIHVLQAGRFLRAGDPRQADEHLRLALELSPRDAEAAYDRALVRLDFNDYRGALHDLLWAEAQTGGVLVPGQRQAVLGLVATEAQAAGDSALAEASRHPAALPASAH